MKSYSKNSLFVGLLALVAVVLVGSQAMAARPLPAASVMAVYVAADWCPSCKIIGPALEKVRQEGELNSKNILFVTLNLTDKSTIHQSILLAQALGIGEYLKAQGSGTGYVALLDAKTKKELTRFERTTTSEAMIREIAKRL